MDGRRIALIGATGQLGTDLVVALGDWDLVPLTHRDIEICDYAQTRRILESIRPDVVINTAAFVRVDDCEDQVEKAFSVNAFAVRNLAQVCAQLDSTLVHISTDYVFDGEKRKPYTEDDVPNPVNVYGASKLAGEHFVRATCPKHLIIRTSGLYGITGSSGKGGNFVETMIDLAKEGKPIRVVNDQVLSPTYTRDLAQALACLLGGSAHGVLHVTNSGSCSWHRFAREILRVAGLEADLQAISSLAAGRHAQRPAFSVLTSVRATERGLPTLRPWHTALHAYLRGDDGPNRED